AFGLNAPARAPFDADSSFYKVDITSYIQAVVDGKKQNNGIIVTAAPEDKVSALGANVGFPESSTLNRAIISTERNQPIQLRIYYSQLK
ncbi:MAG TPA: hypothetical protein VK927_11605, partial [Adhaeribacter sp.]|nr:hypothetical protein [Adhaeribacter sp.]